MRNAFLRRTADQRRNDRGRRILALAFVLLLSSLLIAACEDFERSSWIAIRDSDAAVESMTADWSRWSAAEPRVFTDAELENLRGMLYRANEAVSAAEGTFSTYWEVKKLAAQAKAQPADVEAAAQKLRDAVNAAKRAVVSARELWGGMQSKAPAAPVSQAGQPAVSLAGFDYALLLLLLGEFAGAVLSGKKAAITQAAINVVAAVMEAHLAATGEDIDLALPALRARIAARREKLAKK